MADVIERAAIDVFSQVEKTGERITRDGQAPRDCRLPSSWDQALASHGTRTGADAVV
jgi:hypothetical protein